MKPRSGIKKLLLLLPCLAGFVISRPAAADCGALALIVNPANPLTAVSRRELVAIYKGRKTFFEGFSAIMPVDYKDHAACKRVFYRRFLRREVEKIKRYWVKMIFSGNGSPPAMMDDPSQVLDFVAKNKGGIGYVPKGMLDKRVKEIPVR